MLRFKIEIMMLLFAIGLYLLSAFCFSYQISGTSAMSIFPFRFYAFTLTGAGFMLSLIAGVMYSRRK